MKKLIIGILSFVYLAVASGVVIGTHFCMGRITDSGYALSADDKCSKCGMENKNGCCHTEFKFVKLTDDQQQVKASFDVNQPEVAVLVYAISLLQPPQGLEKKLSANYTSPPHYPDNPLYLANSVFRI